jgi:acyl-CoA synthetase (NDP forming)
MILKILEKAPEVDIIIVVVLPQTPALDTENFSKVIIDHYKNSDKPILLLISGSDYTMKIAREISSAGVPVFLDPDDLASALKEYLIYEIQSINNSNVNKSQKQSYFVF